MKTVTNRGQLDSLKVFLDKLSLVICPLINFIIAGFDFHKMTFYDTKSLFDWASVYVKDHLNVILTAEVLYKVCSLNRKVVTVKCKPLISTFLRR